MCSNLKWWIWFAWWIILYFRHSRLFWVYCHKKKHETIADNTPIQIYTNKIKNRIVFKTKTGYKLELPSPKTMKLLESTRKDVNQDKEESVEVVLVYIVI